MLNLFRKLRDYDQARPSFPGEHWLVAAVGSGLLRSARTRRTPVGRALALLAGSALLYRAASGRDGLAKLGRGLARSEPQTPFAGPAKPLGSRVQRFGATWAK